MPEVCSGIPFTIQLGCVFIAPRHSRAGDCDVLSKMHILLICHSGVDPESWPHSTFGIPAYLE